MKWLLVFAIVLFAAIAVHVLLTGRIQYYSSAFNREKNPIGYWGAFLMIVAAFTACVLLIPKYFGQP